MASCYHVSLAFKKNNKQDKMIKDLPLIDFEKKSFGKGF